MSCAVLESQAFPHHVGAAFLLLSERNLELGLSPSSTRAHPSPTPTQPCSSPLLLLLQQIDELLAGSFTQEDEDAILEELDAITQVTGPLALTQAQV